MRLQHFVLSFVLPLCLLTASGCAHTFPDVAARQPSRGEVSAPSDGALLTVFRGARGGNNVVLFDGEGSPLCQLPSRTHCVLRLAPGAHRIYVYWASDFVDVLDVEVASGRRYYATVAAGYLRPVDEKLTPESERWTDLPTFYDTPETVIDEATVPRLLAGMPSFVEIREHGDRRMGSYDERHVEAHTLRADEGI